MKDLKHLLYFENLLQEAQNELILQAQSEGKVCVAYVCENTPEPLLNLPGAFSTRLRAPRTGSMEMATYYMTSFLCEYSRALLERAIELLKNDETLVIVDPAMADNGKYYANLGDWMAECFRRLIKKANIITPNITEACLLTGMEYRPGTHSMAYVTELIDRLSELGPDFVAVTGVSAEPGKVGIVARDNKSGRLCSVMNEALDGTFHGAGDVFASAFAALLTRGAALEDALNAAEEFVTAAIERTAKRNTPRHYGLDFEGVLPKYIEICRGLFE